jgi:hypothetical protein
VHPENQPSDLQDIFAIDTEIRRGQSAVVRVTVTGDFLG